MLVRVQVTYEFCVDAPDEASARILFDAQHALAVSDERCGVVGAIDFSRAERSSQFEDATLDEVPIGAFDYTLRERFSRNDL